MNQRIMLTKKLLKNSLTEMLKTQNIYHISIRELCERAGINRSTFYKYYGSQFDLLEEIETDLLDSIEHFLSQQTDVKSTAVLEQIIKYFDENIDFARLLINSNVDPAFANRLFSLPSIQAMLKTFLGNITEPNEYEYRTNMLIYGAYQVVCMWLNKENRESSQWMAKFLVDNLTK